MANLRRKLIETDTVGLALAHDSAPLHVTGTATYIDDMLEPEGLLHLAPGFANDAARGKIVSVDLDAVRKAEGVIAVLTHDDIPGVNDSSLRSAAIQSSQMARLNFMGKLYSRWWRKLAIRRGALRD